MNRPKKKEAPGTAFTSRRSFMLGCLALPAAVVSGRPGVASQAGRSEDDQRRPLQGPSLTADSQLVATYTFERFDVGRHNALPQAAAVAAADQTAGPSFNPLFMFGPSGTGKTHLLHAIGNRAAQRHPRLRIRYRTVHQFASECIDAIRDHRIARFHRLYENVDLLLIDDLQSLRRLERTQEEFARVFDELHQTARQIVIASDRPPERLEMVADRVLNRCLWGLVAEIRPWPVLADRARGRT